jgi:hypothetical protein
MLFHHCECPEEGTRNVVSECIGKLTLIDPANLLSNLKQHLNSSSALTRSTVVTAIKFTISDQVRITEKTREAFVFVVVWYLDLLPVQSVPITTNVVFSNPVHGEVYWIQHYVIKLVSDLRQVGGFLRVLQFPPTIKLTSTI